MEQDWGPVRQGRGLICPSGWTLLTPLQLTHDIRLNLRQTRESSPTWVQTPLSMSLRVQNNLEGLHPLSRHLTTKCSGRALAGEPEDPSRIGRAAWSSLCYSEPHFPHLPSGEVVCDFSKMPASSKINILFPGSCSFSSCLWSP